jgi:hypothetical protein
MTTLKVSAAQIAITIVPRRALFYDRSAGSVWAKAHDCADALQALVQKVDLSCSEVEEDPEISVNGIARGRAEICDQALRKLGNFRLLEIAEKALTESIDALERLSNRDPAQVRLLEMSKQAREDLREGVEATKRLVRERCKIRDRVFV